MKKGFVLLLAVLVELTFVQVVTLAQECQDDALYLADVTVPDGTIFPPGKGFEKVWRLKNSGTCPWGEGYALAFIGGERMEAPEAQALEGQVAPGEAVEIKVAMKAPSVPGAYTGWWRMRNPSGILFGNKIYVQIVVQAGGGRIAFSTGDDVFLMNSDGSDRQKIAPGSQAALSPDGNRLAIVREDGIYVLRLDAGQEEKLTSSPGDGLPAWAPDSRRLAFSNDGRIYIQGGESRAEVASGLEATWSPDGNWLAFSDAGGAIYKIPVAGGESVLLGQGEEPAWSPDGARLAVALAGHIELLNADGSGQVSLTQTQPPAWDKAPAWSPAGDKLAFISTRDGNPEIYIINADGTGLQRLTDTPEQEQFPTWGSLPTSAAPASAPQTGTVKGVLKDGSGNPLANLRLTMSKVLELSVDPISGQIEHLSIQPVEGLVATTGPDGTFTFTAVPQDLYVIQESGTPAGAMLADKYEPNLPLFVPVDKGEFVDLSEVLLCSTP